MTTYTGDLDLARFVLGLGDFVDGHVGTDPDETLGETAPSEPGTVSVHLNGDVAEQLLYARGWHRNGLGAWVAPDGAKVWQLDEALALALTAEVL